MDNKHQIDAPDDPTLGAIEQVSDHSNLSALYPNAHDAWEGTNLLSQEAREQKRAAEQLSISLSIRKWFAIIGILTPLPVILGSVLVSAAYTYLRPENMALLILPVIAVVGVWLTILYKSWKKVGAIFYQHSILATPFVMTLLFMIVASLPVLYLTIDQFYGDSLLLNTVASASIVLAASVAYSGILVFIWTSQKIKGAYKIGLIGIIVGLIGLATMLVTML